MAAWLDQHPVAYSLACWVVFAAFLGCALAPLVRSWRRAPGAPPPAAESSDWPFVLLWLAATFVFRLPLLSLGRELNPDESHLIAEALALQRDWFFWSAVDGTTHGPLDVYPLAVAHLFGLPLNYFTARLVATLALFAAQWALYRAGRALVGQAFARVGALPVACFVMFVADWDFVHYSSEHIPVALIGLGTALLLMAQGDAADRSPRHWRWLLAGALLGAVPLAKFQGGPLAAALLGTAALFELATGGIPWRQRFTRVATLAAASFAVPVLFALVAVLRGAAQDAWISYVRQNFIYAAERHHPPAELLRRFWDYAAVGPEYLPFAAGGTLFIALGLLRVPAFAPALRRYAAFGVVAVVTSLFITLWPGRMYGHYLLWTVLPIGLLAAALLAGWLSAPERSRTPLIWTVLVFLAATVVPQAYHRAAKRPTYIGELAASHVDSAVVRELKRLAPPGSTANVWGWSAQFYVRAGLVPSTRDAHTYNAIAWSPTVDYYRARHLADLRRAPPRLFIDAVGPGNFVFQDRSLAHEMLPELREFVAQHYRFVSEIDGTRIYLRADVSVP